MNNFTTLQLLSLRREFGSLNKQLSDSEVNPKLLMLLKSISVDVTASIVKDSLQSTLSQPTNEADQSEENSIVQDTAEETTEVVMETETIELVAEKSCSPELTREELSYDKLDPKMQKLFNHFVEFFGYPPQYVLAAISQCGVNANEYEIEGWCEANTEGLLAADTSSPQTDNQDSQDNIESLSDDDTQEDHPMECSIPLSEEFLDDPGMCIVHVLCEALGYSIIAIILQVSLRIQMPRLVDLLPV